MLAMLFILVTLLPVTIAALILTIRTRVVLAAAIRAEIRAQGRKLEDDLCAMVELTPLRGGDVPREEIVAILARATALTPKLVKLERRQVSWRIEYALEALALELSRKALALATLAEIRKIVEDGGIGPFPLMPRLSAGEETELVAILRRLPSQVTATINNGAISIIDRGSMFPVAGRWIHCLRLTEASTAEDVLRESRHTSSLDVEICVSIAGDQAFSTDQNTVALVFNGVVVDYYNTDVCSGRGDILGRRAFGHPHPIVDSEGWLVPANAETLGLMVGNGHSAETLEALLAAGYNVVVSNDTADAAEVLAGMSRESRGTLVQGKFVDGRYRLADELRPSRDDRPLHY